MPRPIPGPATGRRRRQIDAAVARALNSGWYILGKEGEAFEREFAEWLGTTRAVGCANGTDALALILRGMGIGEGCTVATVSHTAVATVAAIEMAGATPLLLDIDPDTYTMDPDELAAVLGDPPPGLPPIRAAIAVHIYGQACDLDPMLAACQQAGVALIEDCAQAHGAMLGGRRVGTMGNAAAFSLYPTKNLGALGDGGVLATDDFELADRIGAIRQYGWRERYISSMVGVNSRLDEMQAAILRVKLPMLDANNARRREIAAAYDAALAGGPLAPPVRRADSRACLPPVRPADRGAGRTAGAAAGRWRRHRHPLPGAGASAVRLPGPHGPGPGRLRGDGAGGGGGGEPADVSRADRGAGGADLRRAAEPGGVAPPRLTEYAGGAHTSAARRVSHGCT